MKQILNLIYWYLFIDAMYTLDFKVSSFIFYDCTCIFAKSLNF